MNKFARRATDNGRTTVLGHRPAVLIVDDEASVRESLRRVLGAAGYRAVAVPDTYEAFIRLTEETFDALILDICLENGRSGLEVLEVASSIDSLAEVPAIVLTGVPRLTTQDEETVRRYGANVFFKPQIPELLEHLDALMQHI